LKKEVIIVADVKDNELDKKKTTTTNKASTNKVATSKEAKTTKQAKDTEKKVESKATTTAKKEVAKAESKVKVEEKTNISKDTAKNEELVENEELVAKATVKYERISSRKVKIVADLIRGKNVDEAMAILQFTNKAGAEVLTKLLKSAIANAENTKQMAHSKLYIAEIYSNQGPTLKRIRAAAKGSAVRIRKRTSHTTIVLKERD
jgi:large subunit ribosomal protein L22